MADYLMNLYIDRSVNDWENVLIQADVPGFKRTFAAISITILHLITSPENWIFDPEDFDAENRLPKEMLILLINQAILTPLK